MDIVSMSSQLKRKTYENQVHEGGVQEFKYVGYGFQKH